MGEFSTAFIEAGQALVRRAAPEQAGVFAGLNPATVNNNDPFVLWVIQTIVIIGMTQILAIILGRIRQPRVISEVIGGVILGPTIMGRIPGFTKSIFPPNSIFFLNLTSTVGLVFFLFLVGLELDVRVVKRNAKPSTIISVTGLVIPLGLGAAIAVPLYDEFIEKTVNRGYFILFVAVAVGITAFPVLCRILTETKLLHTTVGVLVLSAGVGNDVVGWILLALAVALVNASTGLTALWVLLTGLGFILFLLFPVKWAYVWFARRWGGLDRGEPTALMMTITLIMVLFSAFFTDIIGIHPIFGGFLAGLVIPKVNGFEIALVEKLEDFISLLLLPQYFALSGLKTNLGLLDNGITWGYTILICVVAFFSKFLSCAGAAKSFGFNLRESGAVGSLMACKGLVELIVLNVGLSAGILNTRVFSMFVLHAIVLTFITTPLVLFFYPERVRDKTGVASIEAGVAAASSVAAPRGDDDDFKSRFSFILDKLEHLPAAMTFAQLLKVAPAPGPKTINDHSSIEKASVDDSPPETPLPANLRSQPVAVDALRLIELSERTSALLKSHSADVLVRQDPVLSVMRTFGQLNQFSTSTALAVVPEDEFSSNIASHARDTGSQLIVIPWSVAHTDIAADNASSTIVSSNPFDGLFRKNSGADVSTVATSHLLRRVFANSPADVALFLDRGLPSRADGLPHLFLPFFGGPDDRLALSLVVQFCRNAGVSATVVRIRKTDSALTNQDKPESQHLTYGNTLTFPDTVYGQNTQTRLQSDTADNLAWSNYTIPTARPAEITAALSRIAFTEESATKPLHRVLELAAAAASRQSSKPLIIVVGRSRRLAVDSHKQELLQLAQERNTTVTSETPKTFGEVGAALVAAGANASLVVVQASA